VYLGTVQIFEMSWVSYLEKLMAFWNFRVQILATRSIICVRHLMRIAG